MYKSNCSIKGKKVVPERGFEPLSLAAGDFKSQLQVAFIRLIGSRAYTHSRLPFQFKLYQKHRNVLIEYDENYKVFYNCMVDLEQGKLRIDKKNIIFANGYIIV